ncbi:MAG: DUF1501 domain-containing protein [Planctomycetota bacterium]|nr:MAG: DUF1501 domain-containing protein [Planctomycetota bacterium]
MFAGCKRGGEAKGSMNSELLDRRQVLRLAGAGLLGACCARWLPALATAAAADPRRRRSCILLWMAGGPSQTDTFDMKPGHNNGGPFQEIATSAPGLRFSEHLPQLAAHADRLAVVRSLSTKEGDHDRGTHLVRTGQPPMGPVAHPSIACALAKELATPAQSLPAYVSVAPPQQVSPAAFGPGFLGPSYAPAIVGSQPPAPATAVQSAPQANFVDLTLDDLDLPAGVSELQAARRTQLWRAWEDKFLALRHDAAFHAHHAIYRKAADLMRPEVRAAFDLKQEPEETRRRYGPGVFGQGCLLARRLVERGVPFVEVALGAGGLGWDTHQDNFTQVRRLSAELDAGWATLMTELQQRGLLDSTTILWIGEFGRTPAINQMTGRDHYPQAWSCVLGGGGIAGGEAYGRTSADGMVVEENQVGIGDVLATLCAALGVPPDHENITDAGRPVKLAEGTAIDALLA